MARVTVKERLHRLGQRALTNLEKEMDVVRHEHISIDDKCKPFSGFLKKDLKLTKVVLILKDHLALIASADHVI